MNQVGRYTQGHFENLLSKYDANNDGVLDKSDVSKLKSQGAGESVGKGILAVLTGGLSALGTGFDSKGGRKADELSKLLGRDPNGRIDQNDVLRPNTQRREKDVNININIDEVHVRDQERSGRTDTSDLLQPVDSSACDGMERPRRQTDVEFTTPDGYKIKMDARDYFLSKINNIFVE